MDRDAIPAPLPLVRRTVRKLLLASAAFEELDPDRKREVATAMVRVCQTAIALLREELESDAMARRAGERDVGAAQSLATNTAIPPDRRAPLAAAQNAGTQFSGAATDRLASTTHAVLKAVSFPRFVTDLINGVFKALVDTNQQQMQSYVELIKNVAASTEGFADANLASGRARQWLIDQYPDAFEMDGDIDEDRDPNDPLEEPSEARLKLRDGGQLPSEGALRTGLGLQPGESVPSGDPETTLVPFARRALARQRQQTLATMVMLGMQRIVIESGRLNASMRFHVDARSAAESDAGSRFDFSNRFEASARFGAGPWGVEAKMTNTIGYVSTQRDQTTEEINTDLDLNSSVELYFKTDYLPLEMLAGKGQVDRIKVNTLNPDADAKSSRDERKARLAATRSDEAARRSSLGDFLAPRPEPPSRSGARTRQQPNETMGANRVNERGAGGGGARGRDSEREAGNTRAAGADHGSTRNDDEPDVGTQRREAPAANRQRQTQSGDKSSQRAQSSAVNEQSRSQSAPAS
jgi:hypothetical protein